MNLKSLGIRRGKNVVLNVSKFSYPDRMPPKHLRIGTNKGKREAESGDEAPRKKTKNSSMFAVWATDRPPPLPSPLLGLLRHLERQPASQQIEGRGSIQGFDCCQQGLHSKVLT